MVTIPKHIFWMAKALEQGLTQGVEFWAEDTVDRTRWLETDPNAWHVIAGTMLVGCYSYAEGELGRRWWHAMNSSAAKRDLDLHWIVRNAFVHEDSVPENLRSTSSTDIARIKDYCQDLKDGKIEDDLGNKYPVHMEFQGNRLVLNREAIKLFARLFETTYRSFKS